MGRSVRRIIKLVQLNVTRDDEVVSLTGENVISCMFISMFSAYGQFYS